MNYGHKNSISFVPFTGTIEDKNCSERQAIQEPQRPQNGYQYQEFAANTCIFPLLWRGAGSKTASAAPMVRQWRRLFNKNKITPT